MRLLLDVLQHSHDAEDAWQETWGSLWRSQGRIPSGREAWPFIRTTALRKGIDRIRRRDGSASLEPEAQDVDAGAETESCPRLHRLPPRERAALVLYFWEGLSISEIGDVMNVPAGTVKSWMFRGRERLRRWMAERKEA